MKTDIERISIMTDRATASPEQTAQFFQYIHDRVSEDQWDELCKIMYETRRAGARLTFDDVIAILESVVLSGDSTVTTEDLMRLGE